MEGVTVDDDRRSNVGGAEPGVDASPAPDDVGEPSGRELELRARSLRARDTHNVPERMRGEDEEGGGDVHRRP
jgi:hypothetical protein